MKRLVKKMIVGLYNLNLINDVFITKWKYRYKCHKKLDLKNPKNLNEKINWMKLYGDTSRWGELADKYAVRSYIESCGYKDSLVKLYGYWESPEDIEWDILPNKFVMKMNNGCGDIVICENKETINKEQIKSHFVKLIDQKYGIDSGEPHYATIKPYIIAEELLDTTKQNIPSTSLIDYKFYCSNGVPLCVFMACNRGSGTASIALYDTNWNSLEKYLVPNSHYHPLTCDVPRPKTFNDMLEMAKTLSSGFPIVRVDLYEVDGKVYFGELTFTPQGGYLYNFNDDFLNQLGEKVNIYDK
mgnify:CR=1 FL=1